jgi:integrase
MNTTVPIREKEHVQAIAQHYIDENKYRNHALFVLGVHSALRISDLLKLRWGDVYNFENNHILTHINLTEQKTGKTTCIALEKETMRALWLYFIHIDKPAPDMPIFINARTGKAISRVQGYRIIRGGGEAVNLPYRISCHSLRKTFGYHAWNSGVPVPVVLEIFNHSSISITRRYLGVTQDEKDKATLSVSFGLKS